MASFHKGKNCKHNVSVQERAHCRCHPNRKNQNFLMLLVIFSTGRQSTQVMKKRNHLNVSCVEQVLKRKTSAQTTLRKIKLSCQQSKVSSLEID